MAPSIPFNKQFLKAITTMAIFLFVLPDADQLLSTQVIGPALDMFSYFDKLPIELRYMVWELAFPSAMYHSFELPFTGWHIFWMANVPITLCINHESRTFTLKKYKLLKYHYLRNLWTPRPMYINPATDIISISKTYITGASTTMNYLLYRGMSHTFWHNVELISSIKVVELRCFGWHDNDAEYRATTGSRMMAWFSGLEELWLVEELEIYSRGLDNNMEAGFSFLTEWYARRKAAFPSHKFPVVKWKRSKFNGSGGNGGNLVSLGDYPPEDVLSLL